MSQLNLTSGGGGPYIRFLPSANAWMIGKDEFTLKKFVMDQTSIKTGWGKMETGEAPNWVWDASPGVSGPKPSDDHKRGFAICLFIKSQGTVEWSTTGVGQVMGFVAIYDDIFKAQADNPGQVPILEYSGSDAIKIGKGNTRKPKFSILGWVEHSSIAWGATADEPADPAPVQALKPAPVAAPKAGLSFASLDD